MLNAAIIGQVVNIGNHGTCSCKVNDVVSIATCDNYVLTEAG